MPLHLHQVHAIAHLKASLLLMAVAFQGSTNFDGIEVSFEFAEFNGFTEDNGMVELTLDNAPVVGFSL